MNLTDAQKLASFLPPTFIPLLNEHFPELVWTQEDYRLCVGAHEAATPEPVTLRDGKAVDLSWDVAAPQATDATLLQMDLAKAQVRLLDWLQSHPRPQQAFTQANQADTSAAQASTSSARDAAMQQSAADVTGTWARYGAQQQNLAQNQLADEVTPTGARLMRGSPSYQAWMRRSQYDNDLYGLNMTFRSQASWAANTPIGCGYGHIAHRTTEVGPLKDGAHFCRECNSMTESLVVLVQRKALRAE